MFCPLLTWKKHANRYKEHFAVVTIWTNGTSDATATKFSDYSSPDSLPAPWCGTVIKVVRKFE